MKCLYRILTVLILASFLFAGCTTTPPAAPETVEVPVEVTRIVEATRIVEVEKIVEVPAPTDAPPPPPPTPTMPPIPEEQLEVMAVKVDDIPVIDGLADEVWDSAPETEMGPMTFKAVYSDDKVALLLKWPDRTLNINSAGTWVYQPDKKGWWTTPEMVRRQNNEWLDLAFEITDGTITTEGCAAFCHEYPPGSGEFHHMTGNPGEHVDTWLLLGKHGFGDMRNADLGWLLGSAQVIQSGEITFDVNHPYDFHQPIGGSVTFQGYAEDRVIAAANDTKYTSRSLPGDAYCIGCHAEMAVPGDPLKKDFTFADEGTIPYFGNWNTTHTAPLYIEVAPADFADCMIISQTEIDNGEAVAIAESTPDQLKTYWAKYEAHNGVVPQLILREPSGSQADVQAAANWTDGMWTYELVRNLVTGFEDDVQFNDLTRGYPFSMSLITHSDEIDHGMVSDQGGILKFQP